MIKNSQRQTEERSEKVMEVGEKEGELQKVEELRNQHRDDEASISGSMLAIGATITDSSDPENSGSKQNADEEFTLLSWPPQFLPGLHEDNRDAILGDEFRPVYQSDSIDGSDSDDSEESNDKHGSSCDPSDNHNQDIHANYNVYSNDHVKVQEQGLPPSVFHLHNMQTEFEDAYPSALERSGKGVEEKEEEEEEHEEREARSQWKDQEVPLPSSTSEDGDTLSTSTEAESSEHEGSFQEEFSVTPLSPSFVPGQLDDSEDDMPPPRHPPGYQKSFFGCMRPGRSSSCFWPFDLSLCRLS